MKQRRHYTDEFKAEAIALALSTEDRSVEQLALDLGIPKPTYQRWVSDAMKKTTAKPQNNTKVRKQDYQSLERELRKAQRELGIKNKEIAVLKKATAYFAKDQL